MPMNRSGLSHLVIEAQAGQSQPPFRVLDADGNVLFEVTMQGITALGRIGEVDTDLFDPFGYGTLPVIFDSDNDEPTDGWWEFVNPADGAGASGWYFTDRQAHAYTRLSVGGTSQHRATYQGYVEDDTGSATAQFSHGVVILPNGTNPSFTHSASFSSPLGNMFLHVVNGQIEEHTFMLRAFTGQTETLFHLIDHSSVEMFEVTGDGRIGLHGATPQAQSGAIANAAGGSVIDVEARAALNTLLAHLRLRGDIHV